MAHAQVPEMMLELGALLGPDRVRRPTALEAAACETVVEPVNIEELAELVRRCEADRIALAPIGAARTLGRIRARPIEVGVSLLRMARVVAYEPEDMTVVAQAGLTLAALNQHLAVHRQQLPLDPPKPGLATLGATLGAAKSGPLRHSEGLVRDLLIGIQFVGRDGRTIRAGGRVVKNVAGYDLMKVLAGSFGTLGIITEVCFKVRPLAQLYFLATEPHDSIADAFAAAAILNDALPLSHLEATSAKVSGAFGHPGKFLVVAGLAGNEPERDFQKERISKILVRGVEFFDADRAIEVYQTLRDCEFPDSAVVAELAVLPAALARCLGECGAEFRAHAGCGVAQIAAGGLSGAEQARRLVARWRGIARSARGHLRVIATAPGLRDGLSCFDDPAPGALRLMRRLKAAFDPAGVFNPGCFVGGL